MNSVRFGSSHLIKVPKGCSQMVCNELGRVAGLKTQGKQSKYKHDIFVAAAWMQGAGEKDNFKHIVVDVRDDTNFVFGYKGPNNFKRTFADNLEVVLRNG